MSSAAREAAADLLGYAHALLVTEFFASERAEPLTYISLSDVDAVVQRIARGPEGIALAGYIQTHRHEILLAASAAQNPSQAIATWVQTHQHDAYAHLNAEAG